MIMLPPNWASCEIGQVARVIGGATPPSKDATNFSDKDGIPWITPADLSGYRAMHITRGARSLSEKGFAISSTAMLPSGAVLFSSRAPVGYVAITAGPVCTNQGFKSFVLPEGIDSRFVYFYLRFIKPLAEARATGTTFKELSGAAAARLPLSIAPLNEQRRIADKLDAVLARVDACRKRLDRVPAILKRFRQSVLAAATSGKLTEDWRSGNTSPREFIAEVLPDNGIRESFSANKAKQSDGGCSERSSRCSNPADIGKSQLPPNWQRSLVIDLLSEPLTNGRSVPTADEGFPVLRLTALKDGWIDLDERKTGAWTAEAAKKFLVKRGDFYISRGNGSPALVGRGGLVRGEPVPVAFPDTMIRIHVQETILSPEFLRLAWNANTVREQIALVAHTTAGIWKVNQGEVESILLPVPPLTEQQEIVRRVEVLFAYADRLEARYGAGRAQVERLTPALLAKAFRGELVPQDPSDEPATVLLERIRTARAAASHKGDQPRATVRRTRGFAGPGAR